VSIGVVMATRNRRERALASLDRLAELPERPPLVVVDNGSTDGTAAAIARRHPSVDVIELETNAGAAARTAGAAALGMPIVAFADDDSWWAPGALRQAERVFSAHPHLGLLQGRILVEPGGRLDPICAAMARTSLPAPPGLPGPAVLGFIACGAVVRRDPFLELGGFHPRLGVGGEEELLALDLASAGWQLAYVDSVVAHHHPLAGDGRPNREALQLRNSLWVAWLRRRAWSALARSLRVAWTLLRRGDARALIAIARGLPWVLGERRPVPWHVERVARAAGRPAGSGR
jgi:GT2 family glycosyltransferase